MTFIYLASVGPVDDQILEVAEANLVRAFGLPMKRMEPLEEPVYAFDAQRHQYASNLILSRLIRIIPPDASRLLAVTEKDLFVPILSFVFGHAQLQGPAAIVSLARLRQEFYGMPPARPLLHARATKEMLHEVGHTLGLVHCGDRACPMSLSSNIRQVDAKRSEFCASCFILVKENTDMIRRKSARPNDVEDGR